MNVLNTNSDHPRDVYLSFFMFTTNLRPADPEARRNLSRQMRVLVDQGYTGFEFPIAPTAEKDFEKDLQAYGDLRAFLDSEGFTDVAIATNVAATAEYDPSSSDAAVRQEALEYLESRVAITAALRGTIMMGPDILPYGQFPAFAAQEAIWSDRLQSWAEERYGYALRIYHQLGQYAESKQVNIAIEPITHWETPGPNRLAQLISFLENVESSTIGVVIDSAHEVLDGDGPEVFQEQVETLVKMNRLHYVQLSAPDRGTLSTAWIPWQSFLQTICPVYDGPLAVEIFNALPEFCEGLRLTRKKYWIPDQDPPVAGQPSAYEAARDSLEKVKAELKRYQSQVH